MLDLCSNLSSEMKQKLRFCITRQFELGCRAIIYGKKVLSKRECDEIEQVIKTMRN